MSALRQSRRASFQESAVNTISSFLISWILNVYVFAPMLGYKMSAQQGFWTTALFCIVSLIRNYIIRRIFERRLKP